MRNNAIRATALLAVSVLVLASCDGRNGGREEGARPAAQPPTNRIDLPVSVRRNLGITFATVERRDVKQTLRVPGRFELLPTARREYRAPLPGRVDVFTVQYQRVEAGTPLFRIDSSQWTDLHEQIEAAQARAESMVPLREAHRVHEKSLADKVTLWQERLGQLESLRAAGGGIASQFTEARAMLNAAQAELADVMEKDAALHAQQRQIEAELRSLRSRLDQLTRGSACGGDRNPSRPSDGFVVCAADPGIVESISITPGGLVEENGLIITLVQPDLIRFRATALQSDLGRLRDGLSSRIAPPQGGTIDLQDTMQGTLHISPVADAVERTADLLVQPDSLSSWARPGVTGHLEVTLDGGGAGSQELAIPLSAVVRDGLTPIIFRRDPANKDKVIRLEADLGPSDGRWIVISSGVKEGDEVVMAGNYQLMLATSLAAGDARRGGHFHADGTYHEGEH